MFHPLPDLTNALIIGTGGRAKVFEHPDDNTLCIKLLNEPITIDDSKRLLRLLNATDWAMPSDLHTWTTRFSWPIEGYKENGLIAGFAMPKAPFSAWFELTAARKTTPKLLQLKYFNDTSFWAGKAIQSPQPEMGDSGRRELAIDIIRSVKTLHNNDLVYGDISDNNFCANIGDLPEIFIIDTDSIGSAEEIEKENIKTPDWDAPNHFDPFERDRALTAVLIWRLFTGELKSYPIERPTKPVLIGGNTNTSSLLISIYATGEKEYLDELQTELCSIRNHLEQQKAFDRAVQSNFARNLLEETNAENPIYSRFRHDATQQLSVEESIEKNTGRERLRLISSASYSSFTLDIAPKIANSIKPDSTEELREMILDAQFAVIARELSARGLGSLENDSWLSRAIQHAIVESSSLNILKKEETGKAIFSWEWSSSFINEIVVEVKSDERKSVKQNFKRKDFDGEASFEIPDDAGMQGKVRFTPAVTSPTGKTFFAPKEACEIFEFNFPPIPKFVPVNVQRERQTITPIQLIDEDKRLHMAKEILQNKQKKRKRAFLATFSAISILLGAFYAIDTFSNSSETFIGFESNRNEAGKNSDSWKLYVADSAGTNKDIRHYRELINGRFVDRCSNPLSSRSGMQWSPDGERMAFATNCDGDWDIWVVEESTREYKPITDNDWDDKNPTWFPNGQHIGFESNRNEAGKNSDSWKLYVADSAGTNQYIRHYRELINGRFVDRCSNPSSSRSGMQWSPDGERMAFATNCDGDWDIWVVEESTREYKPITDNDWDDKNPTWFPNGQHIGFESNRNEAGKNSDSWKLYVADSAGTNQYIRHYRELINGRFVDRCSNPSSSRSGMQWSPDGERMAFATNCDGDWDIWVVEESTREYKPITDNDWDDKNPTWFP